MGYEVDIGGKTYSFEDESKTRQFLEALQALNSVQEQNQKITDSAKLAEINSINQKITDSANAAKSKDETQRNFITGLAKGVAGPLAAIPAESMLGAADGNDNASPIGAAVSQFANSTLLNKLPELTAFISEKFGGLPYSEGVQKARADVQSNKEAYPESSQLGDLLGMLLPTKGISGVTNIASKALGVESLLARMGMNAAGNVAVGQATMPSESSSSDRLKQAGMDTAISGAADSLIGVIGKYAQAKNLAGNLENPAYIPNLKDPIPEAALAKRELENAGFNISSMPAETREPSGLDSLQSFLQKSPSSQQTMKEAGKKASLDLDQIALSLEAGLDLNPRLQKTAIGDLEVLSQPIDTAIEMHGLGNAFAKKQEEVKKLISADAENLQNKVLLKLSGKKFSPDSTLQAIDVVTKEAQGGVGLKARSSEFKSLLNSPNVRPIKQIKLKKEIDEVTGIHKSYESGGTDIWNLYKFNKDLNASLRSGKLSEVEEALAMKIKDGITQDLERMSRIRKDLKKAADKILQHNASASKLYDAIDSQFLKSVQKYSEAGDTKKLNTMVMNAFKYNDVSGLKNVERVLGPDAVKPLKQDFIQRILRGDTKNQFSFDLLGGSRTSPKSNPLVKRLAPYNDNLLEYVLGSKEEVKKLRNLATIAPYLDNASQARMGDKFDVVDSLAYGAAAAPAIKGISTGEPGAIVKGIGYLGGVIGLNKALAKFYTHPEIGLLLTNKTKNVITPSAAGFLSKRVVQKLVELTARENGIQKPEETRLVE